MTILDLAEADTVERSFLQQALRQALERGIVSRRQVRSAILTDHARSVLGAMLRKVA